LEQVGPHGLRATGWLTARWVAKLTLPPDADPSATAAIVHHIAARRIATKILSEEPPGKLLNHPWPLPRVAW
jgi:hypothetical protein